MGAGALCGSVPSPRTFAGRGCKSLSRHQIYKVNKLVSPSSAGFRCISGHSSSIRAHHGVPNDQTDRTRPHLSPTSIRCRDHRAVRMLVHIVSAELSRPCCLVARVSFEVLQERVTLRGHDMTEGKRTLEINLVRTVLLPPGTRVARPPRSRWCSSPAPSAALARWRSLTST